MRTLSSKMTSIPKLLFPSFSILVVLMQLILGEYLPGLLCVPIFLGMFLVTRKLFYVELGDETFRFTAGSRWASVPFEDVLAVYYERIFFGWDIIRVELREGAARTQTVRFMPMIHPSMMLIGKGRPQCHPIADELRELAVAARAVSDVS